MTSTYDRESEFERGAALLDESIETLTLALGWRFTEEEAAVILRQLKQIQAAVTEGDFALLELPTATGPQSC